jgi:hypothetical protein
LLDCKLGHYKAGPRLDPRTAGMCKITHTLA